MAFCTRKRLSQIEEKLELALFNQNTIIGELQKMSTNPPVTQAQFTADLTALQTALDTGLSDIAAEIAALKAQIAAGSTPDFTALDTTVNAMTAQVKAADPGAQSTPPAA